MCARIFWWLNYSTAGATAAAGTVTTIVGPDGLGFTLAGVGLLGAVVTRAAQWLSRRPRSFDKAFDVGYELGEAKGFRDGRHVPGLRSVPLRTECDHCGEVTPVRPASRSDSALRG